MLKDPGLFWKNFRLGTELQISGSFLYNAIYFFDKMETFYYDEECFEFMYSTSIGIERLEKIAIILLEHSGETDQEEFEKSLITHNHLELLDRIKKIKSVSLGKTHIKFLQLLQTFYTSSRYDRFNLASVFRREQDRHVLTTYIADELKIEINTEIFSPSQNNDQIKKFIGKLIIKISSELYKIISDRAFELGIFTYELSLESKAFKIFIGQEPDFQKEKLLQKEILLSLINNKKKDKFMEFVKNIKPIKLESYKTSEYVRFLFDFNNKRHMIGELETIYEDTKFDKDRYDAIMTLGQSIDFED